MINCICPKCRKNYSAKTQEFGKTITCKSCSNAWVLDVDDIVRFTLPSIIKIRIENTDCERLPYKEIKIEYNYPILITITDSEGIAFISDDMIKKALSDYISKNGIMDHKYDDSSIQRYIHIYVDSNVKTVDLSENQKEIEIIFKV